MMEYESFLKEIDLLEANSIPFVAFKYPNDSELHLLIGENKDKDNCFVFHSFDNKKEVLLGQYYKKSIIKNKEIEDFLNIDVYINKKEHVSLVNRAVNCIGKGEFKKVVLSRKIDLNIRKLKAGEYFDRVINIYPSDFCYVLFHPNEGMWIASTPETLLKFYNGNIYTMSLAGTQKTESPKRLPIWSDKEIEEQRIVTDSIVRGVEKYTSCFCVKDTKSVRAGGIWHICTEISGTLDKEKVWNLVDELHPTPAICGYPTDKARDFILKNEGYDREFYSGYCGYIDMKQNIANIFVNLRCVKIKEGVASVYVGGGITKDSIADREWEETCNKAQTILKVL